MPVDWLPPARLAWQSTATRPVPAVLRSGRQQPRSTAWPPTRPPEFHTPRAVRWGPEPRPAAHAVASESIARHWSAGRNRRAARGSADTASRPGHTPPPPGRCSPGRSSPRPDGQTPTGDPPHTARRVSFSCSASPRVERLASLGLVVCVRAPCLRRVWQQGASPGRSRRPGRDAFVFERPPPPVSERRPRSSLPLTRHRPVSRPLVRPRPHWSDRTTPGLFPRHHSHRGGTRQRRQRPVRHRPGCRARHREERGRTRRARSRVRGHPYRSRPRQAPRPRGRCTASPRAARPLSAEASRPEPALQAFHHPQSERRTG